MCSVIRPTDREHVLREVTKFKAQQQGINEKQRIRWQLQLIMYL